MPRIQMLFCAVTLSVAGAAVAQDANPLGLSVDHQTLGVADIQKEAEWYQHVLGFQAGSLNHRPKYNVQSLSIPGFSLNLLSQKGSTRPTATMDTDKQGVLGLTLGSSNIDAAFARLKAAGVEVRETRDAQGKLKDLHFSDPEGNALELASK